MAKPVHIKELVIQLLLESGAKANVLSLKGASPIHYAAPNEKTDILRLFLHHRAQVDPNLSPHHITLQQVAAAKGHLAVVELQLQK
jgi:ankyrin repeat protein